MQFFIPVSADCCSTLGRRPNNGCSYRGSTGSTKVTVPSQVCRHSCCAVPPLLFLYKQAELATSHSPLSILLLIDHQAISHSCQLVFSKQYIPETTFVRDTDLYSSCWRVPFICINEAEMAQGCMARRAADFLLVYVCNMPCPLYRQSGRGHFHPALLDRSEF